MRSRPQNQECNEDSSIGVRCNDSEVSTVETHKRWQDPGNAHVIEQTVTGEGWSGTTQKRYGLPLSMSSRRILMRSSTTIRFTNLQVWSFS